MSKKVTILLDDERAENLRKAARSRGLSFSAFLAEAGRAALKASPSGADEPFELIVEGGSGVKPGIDLNKTSQLLAAEDEQSYGS